MATKKTQPKTIWQALSDFQNNCPVIPKNAKGYGYKYADLPSIMQVINPILRKHGLVVSQPLDERSVVTVLIHIETGEKISSSIKIPDGAILKGMNQYQSDGSAITYYRRYGISALLSISTDEDTDAATPQQAKVEEKPWLKKGSDNYVKVVAHLKKGGSIKDVKRKYQVAESLETILESFKPETVQKA